MAFLSFLLLTLRGPTFVLSIFFTHFNPSCLLSSDLPPENYELNLAAFSRGRRCVFIGH
jgi:hypothetical protein